MFSFHKGILGPFLLWDVAGDRVYVGCEVQPHPDRSRYDHPNETTLPRTFEVEGWSEHAAHATGSACGFSHHWQGIRIAVQNLERDPKDMGGLRI